ncbi:MAG: hypothetical protein ACFFDT_06160, partial [Candidatus Hodarchaeota archaeon]
PDAAKEYLNNGTKTESDFNNSEKEDKVNKKKSNDGGPVKTFISDWWTLEHDLALSGLIREVYVAVQLAKKEKSKGDVLTAREIVEIKRKTKKRIDHWKTRGDTLESMAAKAYKALYKRQASKAVTAQYLADCLSRTSQISEILKNLLPAYLVKAVEYVTGGPKSKE